MEGIGDGFIELLYLKHFGNGPLIYRINGTEFKNPEIDSIALE